MTYILPCKVKAVKNEKGKVAWSKEQHSQS